MPSVQRAVATCPITLKNQRHTGNPDIAQVATARCTDADSFIHQAFITVFLKSKRLSSNRRLNKNTLKQTKMDLKTPETPLSCTRETTLTKEQFIELFRYLKLTRMFDEKTVRLKKQSKLTGGVFTSLGQEATAVGTAFALEPQDFIAPLIRDIGACFVKGIEPRTIFLQYFGRGNAPSRATDVQFHFADLKKGFVGPISHLGDMIPVMTGILLASRMRKEDRVGVAYLGEGSTSTGAFH